MATSERSQRSRHTAAGSTQSSEFEGVGMAHLTVVPTNFEESTKDRQ